jgi:hypothetical protein
MAVEMTALSYLLTLLESGPPNDNSPFWSLVDVAGA